MLTADILTDRGNLKVEFYEQDAPGTVANFVKLARAGYYDGITFHRVIPNFVVQGGCPEGTGRGGPGYTIRDEVDGGNQYHDRGVLSMAKTAAPHTGGSQFFIVLSREQTKHLDRQHTCFGRVTEGLEFIDSIQQGDKIQKITVHES